MAKRKKIIEEEKKDLVCVDVITECNCYVTRERDPGDSWSRDSTSTDWSIEGIELGTDSYRSFPVSFPIEEDREYYLLYAIWTTGDSFGRDDSSQFEGIALYEDKEKAYDAEKVIRKHADLYRELNNYYSRTPKPKKPNDYQEYTVNINLEDGTILPVHAGWNGYFESLDRVDVEIVTLKRRHK